MGERRKHCHCKGTAGCGKIVCRRTRQRHYKRQQDRGLEQNILPSRYPSKNEPPSDREEASDDGEEGGTTLGSWDERTMDVDVDGEGVDEIGMFDFMADVDRSETGMEEDGEKISDEGSRTGDELLDGVAEEGIQYEWSYDQDKDRDIPLSLREHLDSLLELLGPQNDAELHRLRDQILSDLDRDNIRAFKLQIISNMSRTAFNHMRSSFDHKLEISSESVILHRIAVLSGIEPQWFHCCPNSCVAYTRKYPDLLACPHCKEPRFVDEKPARLFCYLPCIPRFRGFFMNPSKVREMRYPTRRIHIPEEISDVWDSQHIHTLKNKFVEIDGKVQTFRYFENDTDGAFAVASDGYLLHKKRRDGPTATPLLLVNYNIPPETRMHHENLMCLGIIPGPHGPKDTESFLCPFDDECAEMAHGVPMFNSVVNKTFDFRGYNIFSLGDIVALEKFLGNKGKNSRSPCRRCNIKGFRDISGGKTVYYVPLMAPRTPGEPDRSWNPKRLPMRTHESFAEVLKEMEAAPNNTRREEIAKYHGIREAPAVHRVKSLDYARSLPYDWMHALLENDVPILIDFWTGRFKGLDTGSEDYEISVDDWEAIGQETAEAVKDIPADFVRVLPNIATNRRDFTAEAWAFWFMYLAPSLLLNRLPQKYYDHMCNLVSIMKRSIQFRITHAELDVLEDDIIAWVQMYEKYYYQYREDRLSACPLVIHALLHVVDNIRYCGPCWTTWVFFMERFCGRLQSGLKSKSQPWANLNKRVLKEAYLGQLAARYDLTAELASTRKRFFDQPSSHERIYPSYPVSALRFPFDITFIPDDETRSKVASYFYQVLGHTKASIKAKLPQRMPSWGKVRILHGGDSIRTAHISGQKRNTSYIRYEVSVKNPNYKRKKDEQEWIRQVFYGRLEKILLCRLPDDTFWGDFRNTERLLAAITPCQTHGLDATEGTVMYADHEYTTVIVTDLQAVEAVVGRVFTGGRWSIIDRSSSLARTVFVEDIGPEDDEGVDDESAEE